MTASARQPMTYVFARGTTPKRVPERLTLPAGVRLPKPVIDEPGSAFDLGDSCIWIALKLHLPTRTGFARRGTSAGLLVLPNLVWLDAAGEQALARAASKFEAALQRTPNGPERYADAALAEITALAQQVIAERARPRRGPLKLVPQVHAAKEKMPHTAEQFAELIQMEHRVSPEYRVESSGFFVAELEEGIRFVFGADREDEDPRWFYYVEDFDFGSIDEGEFVESVAEVREIADRWLGAVTGEFALTKRVGTAVRSHLSGERGEVVDFSFPKRSRERRSYVVEWDSGRSESGLFDRDLA